jgi:hypothetical protein
MSLLLQTGEVPRKPVRPPARPIEEGSKARKTCQIESSIPGKSLTWHIEGWGCGVSDLSSDAAASDHARRVAGWPGAWMRMYVRQLATADFMAAIAAVGISFGLDQNARYLLFSLALPLLWAIALRVFDAYEWPFLATGADEFRKVLNAGLCLTVGLALPSYAVHNELSRVRTFPGRVSPTGPAMRGELIVRA